MKRVTKYQDDGGGIHDTPAEARQADRDIKLMEDMLDIAQTIHSYNQTADQLAKELFDNQSSFEFALGIKKKAYCTVNDILLHKLQESEYLLLKEAFNDGGLAIAFKELED
jgi:hypothetical protein